jgi:HSP20 family protein
MEDSPMYALNTRVYNRAPFSLFDSIVNELLQRPAETSAATPAAVQARLDVVEHEKTYEVRAELPGVAKEDIEVDINGAQVSIRASVKTEVEPTKAGKIIYAERSATHYARSFELPQAVDEATAQARLENGVLTLVLPKKDALQTKRLNIQ